IAAVVLKFNPDRLRRRHCADNSDYRCWMNGNAESFIVETDIAARDGSLKKPACIRHSLYRFNELRHDLGALRVAEIQVIRGGDRVRAHHRKIAAAFRDNELCSLARIERAISSVSVKGHRDGGGSALNSDHCRFRPG